MSPAIIRVAIAEDHELVREGFKSLLKDEPSIKLVGEAANGQAAIDLVNQIKPDVLMLDLRMPGLHGLEVLRQLQGNRATRVLVVTMHSDEPYIVEAIRNGASGYLLKDSSKNVLIEGIRAVAAGGEFLCDPVRQKALSTTLKRMLSGSRASRLTKRELIVLEHAAAGKTSTEIGLILSISRRTAEAHRASVMRKLGLKNQTDLVLYAIRNGLMSP